MSLNALLACVLGAGAQPAGRPQADKPLVPFPHPLITEVLYSVPSGKDGDANKSGERSATADEFVELVNPHDKPIQLKGYMLTDGTPLDSADHSPTARTQIRFTFPDIELKPGQVIVVFNGYKQSVPGPAGDALKAPDATNPNFADAVVFSMKAPSQFVAFNNDGDCVVLKDPKGRAVNCVRWGDYKGTIGSGAFLTDDAPKGIGSIQRVGLTKQMSPHPEIKPGVLFSPGEFDLHAPVPAPRPASKTSKSPAQNSKAEQRPAASPPQSGG